VKLLVEPSRALPLVSFSLTVQAGRLFEPEGLEGLARVTARMLRRGCGSSSAEAIEQRADLLGAEVSTGVGLGWASVSCEVLRRNLDEAVSLVAELVSDPTFDGDELALLLRQSEAELVRSRDNDALLCSRALRRHLMSGHPHAARVQGDLAGLQAIDVDATKRFHAERYGRAGALVAFVGDVDEAAVPGLAERLVAGLPEGRICDYPAPEPSAPKGRRLVVVDKPGRTQAQMAIGTLGTSPADDDHVALWVANCAFGGTFTSRLVQEIRGKRGWSYGVSSHLTTSRVREVFSIWAAPAAEDAGACIALELEMLERWCDAGIDAEELAFCKDYLRRSWAFEIDTAKKRLSQRIERVLLDLDDDYHRLFVERVDAVTLEEANAAIRRRISPRDLWVAAVATDAETGEALRAGIEGLDAHLVDRYDVE
jgi:zinc protease